MKKVKEEVKLYYKISSRIVGLGMVGPTEPVTVLKHLANLLIEKSSDWSLTPFEKENEVTKNAQ